MSSVDDIFCVGSLVSFKEKHADRSSDDICAGVATTGSGLPQNCSALLSSVDAENTDGICVASLPSLKEGESEHADDRTLVPSRLPVI